MKKILLSLALTVTVFPALGQGIVWGGRQYGPADYSNCYTPPPEPGPVTPSGPTSSCSVDSFQLIDYLICNGADAERLFTFYESRGNPVNRGDVSFVLTSYGSAYPGGSRCPDAGGFLYWMDYEANHGNGNLRTWLPVELQAAYPNVIPTMNGYCASYASQNGFTGNFSWAGDINCRCSDQNPQPAPPSPPPAPPAPPPEQPSAPIGGTGSPFVPPPTPVAPAINSGNFYASAYFTNREAGGYLYTCDLGDGLVSCQGTIFEAIGAVQNNSGSDLMIAGGLGNSFMCPTTDALTAYSAISYDDSRCPRPQINGGGWLWPSGHVLVTKYSGSDPGATTQNFNYSVAGRALTFSATVDGVNESRGGSENISVIYNTPATIQ